MIHGKRALPIIVVTLLLFLAYCLYRVDRREEIRATLIKKLNRDGYKKILFWNGMFGNRNFYFGEDSQFRGCPESRCYATSDRAFMDVRDFDAVLFHGSELLERDVPNARLPGQRYFFVNLESPANRPITGNFFEDFFNDTMTYRLDSDVLWPYAILIDEKDAIVSPLRNTTWIDHNATDVAGGGRNATTKDPAKGKTKLVAWLVSNCESKSRRENYVDKLSLHVDVNIYGTCGRNACEKNDPDCFRNVVQPYFFYLAFENTLCEDYVTEKFYNALRHNVVPVVYGGANYSLFAPPNSYVNALDFDSPRQLAAHLREIASDPRKYDGYFAWKRHYRVSHPRAACNLCAYLHGKPRVKTYRQLSGWYMSDKCPLQEKLSTHEYATRLAFDS